MSATLTARQQVEQTHHDRIASHERRDFYAWGALDAADACAYALIDSPAGSAILDLGCGRGTHAVHFARAGARVAAIDLSGGMASMTQRRAMAAGVGARVAVQQMSAESLGFADATFDYVFGHSVLHHTDLAVTRREVHRVLKPGGRAVFLEPLDHNPALNLFRHLTPWRRTPTEKPLSLADLRFLRNRLPPVRIASSISWRSEHSSSCRSRVARCFSTLCACSMPLISGCFVWSLRCDGTPG